MPRWLPRALRRIRGLAAAGRTEFTEKAIAELADLRLGREDAAEILADLRPSDHATRLWSEPATEWLYVFRPLLAGLRLYVKVAIRDDCVVISCHEDQAAEAGQADDREH